MVYPDDEMLIAKKKKLHQKQFIVNELSRKKKLVKIRLNKKKSKCGNKNYINKNIKNKQYKLQEFHR